MELLGAIQSSDFAICNFEGPINSSFSALKKSGPNISQSKDSVKFLKDAGFNIFTLGNNHSMDYGKEGLKYTISFFDKDEVIGAGDFEDAYKIVVKEKDNIRIGFLSLSQFEFGMSESINQTFGVAWINDPIVDEIIVEAKKHLDYLILLPHAGVENIDIPLPEWRQIYKHFIDLGVDAVIAGHPHVPQGKENYKGKCIYYSLGNFYFERMNDDDQRHQHSIMVVMKINDEGYIEFEERIVKRSGYHLSILDFQNSKRYLCDLNNLIVDDQKYRSLVDSISKKFWREIYKKQICYALKKSKLSYGIMYNLKLFVKSLLKKNDRLLLLNCFQCESHRWIIERALRNDSNSI